MGNITEFDNLLKRDPQEVVEEVLSRYSVLDLVEQTLNDLNRGYEKLGKAAGRLKVIETGEVNLIRRWVIKSAAETYEVRRFENFCFCSCMDFFFTKKVCKHITLTTKFYCTSCQRREVEFGKICSFCESHISPYLRPRIEETKPAEIIGGIRI